jgi:hypothetical protein
MGRSRPPRDAAGLESGRSTGYTLVVAPLESVPADPDVELARRVDTLFAGDPDEFVTARDSLAREVRAEGRADDARAVKALRRPTIAAWALNHVAHTRGGDVDSYLDTSASLRDAQERSGDAAVLRDLMERHRSLQRTIVDAAIDAIAARGSNAEAARADVQGSLDAAALDPDVGAAVRAGHLSAPATAESAFDLFDVTPRARPARLAPSPAAKAVAPPPRPAAATPRRDVDEQKARAAKARHEAAQKATATAEARVREARAEVQRLERGLEQARRAAARADRELERARAAEARAITRG